MQNWYESSIFYHIYPLGMTGAPRHNDHSSQSFRFKELIDFIPHIKVLGCNAIYIGPLFESGSHGYDTWDFTRVDSRLGTNDHFKNFISLCHEKGIHVIPDAVFNHTGRDFFAFSDLRKRKWDSPYKDWYRRVDFGHTSPLGDPFSYEAWQGHYELPCLNLKNQSVVNYLLNIVSGWVHEFDIDGLRLDCANVLDFDFMRQLRSFTDKMDKPSFWLMGEVIHGDYARWVNPGMLHSVTNYELHKSLYSGFNDHNFFEIAHNVRRLEAIGRALYTFVDNHDEDRIASKLHNKEHLMPVYVCLMTLPGIPSIYYGSECGIEGKRTRTSDDELRPRFTIQDALKRHCTLTEILSKLCRIHAENPELHTGRYQELLLTNRQYAYCRHGQGSLILTILNNDDISASLNIPVPIHASHISCLLDTTGQNFESYHIKDSKLPVTIKANSGLIFKITGDNI